MTDPIIIHAFYVEKPILFFLRLMHPPIEPYRLAGKRGRKPTLSRGKPRVPT